MKGLNQAVKIGVAPTIRDSSFGIDEAIRYKRLIIDKLNQLHLNYVDIDWLNEDGLLFRCKDVDAIADKFVNEKVDCLFIPHCNFGSENAVAALAKKMNKPLLIWGPRDEAPFDNIGNLRHTQCGMFASSKVLRRQGVPFTYIENSRVDSHIFREGLTNFIAAARVVKSFKNMRIGQISTRPGAFTSVVCNEGELLEKYGIQIEPIDLTELIKSMNILIETNDIRLHEFEHKIKEEMVFEGIESISMNKLAAMKYAIEDWAAEYSLSAVAFQCWNALQDAIGCVPCYINGVLTGEGLPVVCETDICGAVTSVLAQAAKESIEPIFFADLTVRHPTNDNAELLWHCGPFPPELARDSSQRLLSRHYLQNSCCPALGEFEIKHGEITICRFDGDHGEYSFFMALGKGIEGPKSRGTYLWAEFCDWPYIEKKIINGPFIHHVTGVYGNIIPIMTEALKYTPGIKIDV